jgi:hypothetical protein
VNLCVRAAWRSADADHRATGTKEEYDLQREEKHLKEQECSQVDLAEER